MAFESHLHHIRVIGYPERRIELAKQVNFSSRFRYNCWERCPHNCDEDLMTGEESDIDSDNEAENDGHLRFDGLTRQTISLLDGLEENQIRGFR